MEQKKALWISLSAGIFLLTVLGFALFTTSKNAKNNLYAKSLKGTDSIWVSPPPVKKTQSYPTINVTDNTFEAQPDATSYQNTNPISGTYTPNTSDVKAEQDPIVLLSQSVENQNQVVVNQTQSQTLNISNSTVSTDSSTATNAVTAQNAAAEKAIKEAKSTAPKTTTTTKKAESTATAKKSTSTGTKASAPAKTSATKASTATTTQYWVQVSSYSAKKNADEARSVLDSNNLQCEVFTYSKDGTMYYRVRVGPYATKGEADKAKTKIDGITQFKSAGSYVVSVKKEN